MLARRLGRRPHAVRDRRRDPPLHGLSRHPVPEPGADLQPSPGEHRPGRLGRLPRSAARHRAADGDRHRDRRSAGDLLRAVDRRVRASALADTSRGIQHRDRRRNPRHPDRGLRPGDLPAALPRIRLLRPQWRCHGHILPHRRRDDVADRAGRRYSSPPATACRPCPLTCARPPSRSARPASPRSAACCCPPCAPTSPPASRSASAASSPTPRS